MYWNAVYWKKKEKKTLLKLAHASRFHHTSLRNYWNSCTVFMSKKWSSYYQKMLFSTRLCQNWWNWFQLVFNLFPHTLHANYQAVMWRWSPEDELIMPSPKNMVGWLRRREIWTFNRWWNKQHWKLKKCHYYSAKSLNRYTWAKNICAEMCKQQTCSSKWYTVKRKISCKISLVRMWRRRSRIFLLLEMKT